MCVCVCVCVWLDIVPYVCVRFIFLIQTFDDQLIDFNATSNCQELFHAEI